MIKVLVLVIVLASMGCSTIAAGMKGFGDGLQSTRQPQEVDVQCTNNYNGGYHCRN